MANKKFGTFDASSNTSDIRIAVGNTVERPGTPLSGQVRFNSDFNRIENYDSLSWVSSTSIFKKVRATETLTFTVTKAFDSTLTKLNSATPVTFNTTSGASTFEDGFKFSVENIGTSQWTFDPNGLETVNGQSTMIVPPGYFATFYTDGSNWFVLVARQNSAGSSVRDFFTAGGDPSLIQNLLGEVGTGGWSTYNDGTFYVIDGTGGVPAAGFTWTTTAVSPISGSQSFLLTKPAAISCFGNGVSYDFQIQGNFRNMEWSVDLAFRYVTGFEELDNIRVFIYDIDNAQSIELSPHQLIQTAPDGEISFYSGSFRATSSQNYRLCFHVTSRNLNGFSVQMDDIVIRQGSARVLNKYTNDISWANIGVTGFNGVSLAAGSYPGANYGNIEYNQRNATAYIIVPYTGGFLLLSLNPITKNWALVSSQVQAGAIIGDSIYCPVNNVLYVIMSIAGPNLSIRRYDFGTATWLAPIVVAGVGISANGHACYAPSQNKIYFPLNGAIARVLDCNTNTVSSIAGVNGVTASIYCSSNDTIYMRDAAATSVYAISAATDTLVATIATVTQTADSLAWHEKTDFIVAGSRRIISPVSNTTVFINTDTTINTYVYKLGYSPFTSRILTTPNNGVGSGIYEVIPSLTSLTHNFMSTRIDSTAYPVMTGGRSTYIPQFALSGTTCGFMYR